MKLAYYLYRKFKHIPCRQEIADILKKKVYLSPTIKAVAEQYASNYDLIIIANGNNITRERARQYLFKVVRVGKALERCFICFSRSIDNVGGKPRGFVWLTACFTHKNYRLFPVGYIK